MKKISPGDRCIVVGAGISGLLASKCLAAGGVDVTVLDKGRGVGGRMATRRLDRAIFDHGAQFITVRDPGFAQLMEEWTAEGLIGEWTRGFPKPGTVQPDGHPRYFVKHGMTAVPKYLARGLKVHTHARVAEITLDGNWHVRLDSGETLTAEGLILTAPVPQSMDLLDIGGVELPEPEDAQLRAIQYHPCLTWMALPTSDRTLGPPGGVQFLHGSLQFLADNRQKGISETPAITVHASPAFSREHFSGDEIDNWALIVEEVAQFTGPIRRASFQRWRYSQPVESRPERAVAVEMDAALVFCGDAFGGPRIEGAALSGMAAARLIMNA